MWFPAVADTPEEKGNTIQYYAIIISSKPLHLHKLPVYSCIIVQLSSSNCKIRLHLPPVVNKQRERERCFNMKVLQQWQKNDCEYNTEKPGKLIKSTHSNKCTPYSTYKAVVLSLGSGYINKPLVLHSHGFVISAAWLYKMTPLLYALKRPHFIIPSVILGGIDSVRFCTSHTGLCFARFPGQHPLISTNCWGVVSCSVVRLIPYIFCGVCVWRLWCQGYLCSLFCIKKWVPSCVAFVLFVV